LKLAAGATQAPAFFPGRVAQSVERLMPTKRPSARGRALVAVALLGLAEPGHASEPGGVYALTIRNTNTGQNFSPPVIILHDAGYRLFEFGRPATVALWRLAEDGVTSEFLSLAETDAAVQEVIVGEAVHRRNAPVFTTEIETSSDVLVSVAAMLSLTNDGFVAARSVALPTEVAAATTVGLHAFDAGSEANTELCAHVPCEIHDRRMTEGAEGFVSEHPGIRGDADLPLSRAWAGPELGSLTITRLR
jgi:Spondin_N